MIDLINLVGSLGVGAMLAMMMFFVYRYDSKQSMRQIQEDRKYMEDRLTHMIEEDHETKQEHTKALTELTTVLRTMNGKRSS